MVIFYISFFRLCSWRKKCQNVNYYNDVLLCFVQIVGRDTLSIIYIDYQTCKLFLYSRLHWCAIYFTVILPRGYHWYERLSGWGVRSTHRSYWFLLKAIINMSGRKNSKKLCFCPTAHINDCIQQTLIWAAPLKMIKNSKIIWLILMKIYLLFATI